MAQFCIKIGQWFMQTTRHRRLYQCPPISNPLAVGRPESSEGLRRMTKAEAATRSAAHWIRLSASSLGNFRAAKPNVDFLRRSWWDKAQIMTGYTMTGPGPLDPALFTSLSPIMIAAERRPADLQSSSVKRDLAYSQRAQAEQGSRLFQHQGSTQSRTVHRTIAGLTIVFNETTRQ